jgi:hypothetical protein
MLLDQEASESTTFKPSFSDPPSRIFLGHCLGIINTSAESSAQAQSIGTVFEQIELRGGVVDMSKVRGTYARVQAAGCVKPKEHLITPNLQDSFYTRCTMEC